MPKELKPLRGTTMVGGYGQIVVFDEKGEQAYPELHTSLPELWAAFVESRGYDPSTIQLDFVMMGTNLVSIDKREDGSWRWIPQVG